MNKTCTISVLTAVGIVLAVFGTSLFAQEPTIQYRWNHPTTGSPVDHYTGEFQFIEANGDTLGLTTLPIPAGTDPLLAFYTAPYEFGKATRLRVAGIDSLDRQGPWSEWSEWWKDDGPPGKPGTIEQTLTF